MKKDTITNTKVYPLHNKVQFVLCFMFATVFLTFFYFSITNDDLKSCTEITLTKTLMHL